MNAVGGSRIKAIEAFVKASGDGDLATVVEMLEEGRVEVNDAIRYWDTALHAVARNGPENRVALCRLLIEKGAQVNLRSGCGLKPLSLAARYGFVDLCRELIGAGADVEEVEDGAPGGMSPLADAAYYGRTEVCAYLVGEAKANIHAEYHDRKTPLFFALQQGHEETARFLLANGACAASTDWRGRTTLMAAVSCSIELFSLLLVEGADVDATNEFGKSVLHYAAEAGNIELCRKLLDERGFLERINEDTKSWHTPLHFACRSGRVDVVSLLLERGAECSATSKYGDTLLHEAARGGWTDVCALLLRWSGADVDGADPLGRTPLMLTALAGHLETAKFLVEEGARVTFKNRDGQTALMLAVRGSQSSCIDMCKFLVEHGACVRDKDSGGRTVLQHAAGGQAATWLLDNGAEEDLFSIATSGRRPLDEERRWGTSKSYLLLLERMMALRGDAEAEKEVQSEESREFISKALQTLFEPSYEPLPLYRRVLAWTGRSAVAAALQLEWPPTAYMEPSWETKEKRLVAFREDSWRRRAHLVAFYEANNVYTGACLRQEADEVEVGDYDDERKGEGDKKDDNDDEGDEADDKSATEAENDTGDGNTQEQQEASISLKLE